MHVCVTILSTRMEMFENRFGFCLGGREMSPRKVIRLKERGNRRVLMAAVVLQRDAVPSHSWTPSLPLPLLWLKL